jgi:uncharacterized protein involved in exopolysaccharide biosynthesis
MQVDLKAVYQSLVRRMGLIVTITLLAGGGTWGYLKLNPVYEARATLGIAISSRNGQPIYGNGTELQALAETIGHAESEISQKSHLNFSTELLAMRELVLKVHGKDPKQVTDAAEAWPAKVIAEYKKLNRKGTLRIVQSPTEAKGPVYPSGRYALAIGMMTMGLAGVVAAAKNKR